MTGSTRDEQGRHDGDDAPDPELGRGLIYIHEKLGTRISTRPHGVR